MANNERTTAQMIGDLDDLEFSNMMLAILNHRRTRVHQLVTKIEKTGRTAVNCRDYLTKLEDLIIAVKEL